MKSGRIIADSVFFPLWLFVSIVFISLSLHLSISLLFLFSLSLSIYSILFCSNLTQSNPIYLSLSLRLSVRLSVHLSVCLFISLFFHLSTYHYLSSICLPYISIYQNHIYIYITDCVLYLSIFLLLSYPNGMMLLQPQSPDKGAWGHFAVVRVGSEPPLKVGHGGHDRCPVVKHGYKMPDQWAIE